MKIIGGGGTAIEILLVEDDPGDAELTRVAFRTADSSIHLQVVPDGVEAMAFLRCEEPYSDARRPDLILLDLSLPNMDSREVLAQIKADDRLKTIPVVILTLSDAELHISKSYQLHANCHLAKPVQLKAVEDLVRSINDFWLSQIELPPRKPGAWRRR